MAVLETATVGCRQNHSAIDGRKNKHSLNVGRTAQGSGVLWGKVRACVMWCCGEGAMERVATKKCLLGT